MSKMLVAMLFVSSVLMTAGCDEPDDDEGVIINAPPVAQLPVDTLLNLNCPEVGIFTETCVLDDPENPFVDTVIVEFDVNNEEAFNKFELADGITSAKARFYFWATALARRSSGENQWYTARALHELWDAAGDENIRLQALKAYRSCLDNYFGSVTFFTFGVFDNEGNEAAFPFTINELVADNLYRAASTNWAILLADGNTNPELIIAMLGDWGYVYQKATGPDYDNGVVSVIDF